MENVFAENVNVLKLKKDNILDVIVKIAQLAQENVRNYSPAYNVNNFNLVH